MSHRKEKREPNFEPPIFLHHRSIRERADEERVPEPIVTPDRSDRQDTISYVST